jgi:hypothetical protein
VLATTAVALALTATAAGFGLDRDPRTPEVLELKPVPRVINYQ